MARVEFPQPHSADVWFADHWRRPVFEEQDGRQFVDDDDGERVDGVWLIPPEECVQPAIVDARRAAMFVVFSAEAMAIPRIGSRPLSTSVRVKSRYLTLTALDRLT